MDIHNRAESSAPLLPAETSALPPPARHVPGGRRERACAVAEVVFSAAQGLWREYGVDDGMVRVGEVAVVRVVGVWGVGGDNLFFYGL